MLIREAEISDAHAIQNLLKQLGYPTFEEQEVLEKIKIHQNPGFKIFVAEVDNKTVGFISMHWFDLMHWKGYLGRITSFCVDDFFRSMGIGQALLKETEAFLIKQGCLKIEVTSNRKRTRTHEFYLTAGYTEDSRRFNKVC
ncbi:GNAT family N-acetyltransferase [soil metagenome]